MNTPKNASRPAANLEADNRRRAERVESKAPVRVVIETAEFAGTADNLSDVGVFLFAGESVRVRVHVGSESFAGKIVRVQQMSADEVGFAIEFDPR